MPKTTSSSRVKRLGTILGVWAHPDDESFMMAGLMALAVKNGQKVVCVTATRGEQGLQDATRWSLDTLGFVREQELENALKIIGVKYHHWLGYPDGSCNKIKEPEAARQISGFIDLYKPDTVITFPPDGLTGHPDHAAVSGWTSAANKLSRYPASLFYAVDTMEKYDNYLKPIDEKINIYFNIEKPCLIPESECDLLLKLSKESSDIKRRVLAAMPSQTSLMFETFGRNHMEAAMGTEAFVNADKKIKWGTPNP